MVIPHDVPQLLPPGVGQTVVVTLGTIDGHPQGTVRLEKISHTILTLEVVSWGDGVGHPAAPVYVEVIVGQFDGGGIGPGVVVDIFEVKVGVVNVDGADHVSEGILGPLVVVVNRVGDDTNVSSGQSCVATQFV